MRPIQWKTLLLTAVMALLLTGCAAQAESAVSVSAEMGYDGTVTYISTMPLWVRLKNAGGDANLTVAVNITRYGSVYDRYEYPVTLAGGAEMHLTLPMTITYKQPAYTVEVLEDGKVVAGGEVKPRKVVSPYTLLVGVLSDAPQQLRYFNISQANDQLVRGDVWQTVDLTAATFPDNIDMLRAFRILAVDGVDVSAFSQAQQDALRQWIREGGIVIVGGGSTASVSYKFFGPVTGILSAAPYQAQGVDKALAEALSGGQFALSSPGALTGSVMLNGMRGGRGAVAELNGQPLIDRCTVDRGVVYTTAFSLGERPLSAWNGLSGYWQRMLLTYDQGNYQRIINELSSYYDTGYNGNSWVLRYMQLPNRDPVLPAVLLIAAFLALSGIGSYLLLKRLDKREWMWLTVPLLSLVCALLTVGISSRMQLNKPAAVAYEVITVDEAGLAEAHVTAGVASAETKPITVSTVNGETIVPTQADYSSYYPDEEETDKRPPQLRYTYVYGDRMQVILPSAAAWEVQTLKVEPARQPVLPIRASVWWGKDGLHGEVENGTDLTLEPGFIITNQGYCSVPRLMPGEKTEFAILENQSRKQDPDKGYQIYDGEIVASAWVDTYEIVDWALHPKRLQDENYTYSAEEMREMSYKEGLLQACQERWGGRGVFRYVTFTDQAEPVAFALNGNPVERSAFDAVIDTKILYRAVGEEGLVKLTGGMVPAYNCELDSKHAPFSTGVALGNSAYFSLRDEPVLCFALGEIEGLDLSRLKINKASISSESYGVKPRLWLYNTSRGEWQELSFNALPAVISGDLLRTCLDDAGRLFLRAGLPAGVQYGDLDNPSLTLEGRIE